MQAAFVYLYVVQSMSRMNMSLSFLYVHIRFSACPTIKISVAMPLA